MRVDLAGAVRADERMQFAVPEAQSNGVGGDDAAEALGQSIDFEQRLSHRAGLGESVDAAVHVNARRRAETVRGSGPGSR